MSMTGLMSRTIAADDHVILYEYWGKQNALCIKAGEDVQHGTHETVTPSGALST